jgi:hypothetical protein
MCFSMEFGNASKRSLEYLSAQSSQDRAIPLRVASRFRVERATSAALNGIGNLGIPSPIKRRCWKGGIGRMAASHWRVQ